VNKARYAIIAGIGIYALSRPKKGVDIVPIPNKKELEDFQQKEPNTEVGKLYITVYLKASGTEKFAIGLGAYGGESGLRDKVTKIAQDLIPSLNKGPIPKIVSKAYPKSFKSVNGGYRAIIAYIAMFHKGAMAGPVREKALAYITSMLKKDKEFGPRILKVSAVKSN